MTGTWLVQAAAGGKKRDLRVTTGESREEICVPECACATLPPETVSPGQYALLGRTQIKFNFLPIQLGKLRPGDRTHYNRQCESTARLGQRKGSRPTS